MLTIGLTGGIGSGKSTVADMFESLGVRVIDTDAISHQLIEEPEIIKIIVHELGDDFLNDDDRIDRRRLATHVFSNPLMKERLESILHPMIRKQLETTLNTPSPSPYSIAVVPLLIETDFKSLVDKILVVETDEDKRIERIRERDQRDESETKKIMSSQTTRQNRLQWADDIIYNSGTLEDLKCAVDDLHAKYLDISAQ